MNELAVRIATIINEEMSWNSPQLSEHLAETLIRELGLRQEWATRHSLMIGTHYLIRPDDAIATRICTVWNHDE